MNIKRISVLILAVITAFCFASCGKGDGDVSDNNNGGNVSGTGNNKPKTELTLWGSSDDRNMLSGMVSAFRSEFDGNAPEISVKVTGEDKAATEALKDTDAAADVYAISHDQLGSLVEAGAIYQITGDYLSKIKSECNAPSVSAATYNDKVYGFPSSAETYLLYYDKSKLSETDVASLNTILNKKLSSGVYNFGLNFSEGYYGSSIFFTAGCKLFGENGDKADSCDFNNANGMKAAKFIASLKSKNAVNCDENEAVSLLKDGKLASFVGGPWKSEAVKEALGKNYGVAKLPTVELSSGEGQKQMMSFAGYKIYVVNAKTKDPANSMKLAQHLTKEDNQLKRYNDRNLLPVNKTVSAREDVTKDETVAATLKQLEYAVPMPSISQVSKFWTAFAAFAEDCFNGNISESNMQSKLDSMVKQIVS